MSILILNKIEHFKSPYDIWLKELEEDLLMLTTPERAKECDKYKVIETFENYEVNGGVEIRGLELYNAHKFHTILSTSEFDLIRAAQLRECLGIEGQNLKSAVAFRNKGIMKDYVQKAGLKVPSYSSISTPLDLYSFVGKHGYPVVVKPIDGIASKNTTILHNQDELMKFVENGLDPNMEVETFVKGDMYHIDGLFINGTLVHCNPSKYINGCLAFQKGMFNGSYMLDDENPLTPRLIRFTLDVLDAMPIPDSFSFHAEVFHTPDDELVFCEIASRTGGGLIRESIQHSFGFDINKWVALAQTKLARLDDFYKEKKRMNASGFLLIPSQKGIIKNFPNEKYADWVVKSFIKAKINQEYSISHSSVDIVGSFLVEGNSERQIVERIYELYDWFEQSTVWEKGDELNQNKECAVK
ncbi:ATP-grasp domain-containing protein [Paenibacillus dendritiformis]|uniref:ATP-grasp domain-containing protein n=1 Tax=Paenibacillus dendritiformis TaxID=130049 RepID=UPI000DA9263B|nr:carboxylate--amine ligase [Paenibacillus dendritiformis]PZM67595.1 carboxylate--amine ligase [Paenibacillus dendritiformis]